MTTRERYTIELKEMLIIAAGLVDRRGEEMRPIMDRVERDYLAAKTRTNETDQIKNLMVEYEGA